MMNMNYEAPFMFPACKPQCGCNPAVSVNNRIACKNMPNPYARVYVVSQPYNNLAKPECALKNGTWFNDLYMPYVPEEYRCRCEKGGGCNEMRRG